MAGACGDDIDPSDDDGSALHSLTVLDPPGESIGLAFHGEMTLRVRYDDPDGRPMASAPISFELVTSASEATGGATVSASQVATDSRGVAEVDLVVGAERVNFRVQAVAANAPPALFYIAVSEGGFTDLTAVPVHAGFRAGASFGRVDVRLYRGAELACAALDIDAPPTSVLPPRALAGFGGSVTYVNVGAGESYTLVAWASVDVDGPRLAAGCIELGGGQVRAGQTTRLPLPVTDRLPAVPAGLAIESSFDASPLAELMAAVPDVWTRLACPLGRAQLVIDCALDAEAPDGALDCAANGTSQLVVDANARRGRLDANGCRPRAAGGQPTLDALVEEIIGPPWPSGRSLADLLDARLAPLRSFRLDSQLDAGSGAAAFGHRLNRIATAGPSGTFALDLVASTRPIIRQLAPISVDLLRGRLAIGAHRFTLDYGRFARAAFAELGLAAGGLADRADDLGSALYESVALAGQTGCTALSARLCGAIGYPASCLAASCAAAASELDRLFDAGWLLLDGEGRDFALRGSAPLADADGDLVLDNPGQGGEGGTWSGELILSTGDTAAVIGSFSATPAEP